MANAFAWVKNEAGTVLHVAEEIPHGCDVVLRLLADSQQMESAVKSAVSTLLPRMAHLGPPMPVPWLKSRRLSPLPEGPAADRIEWEEIPPGRDEVIMPGRKPKPTALKALAGNPGKRPLNTSETTIHRYTIRSRLAEQRGQEGMEAGGTCRSRTWRIARPTSTRRSRSSTRTTRQSRRTPLRTTCRSPRNYHQHRDQLVKPTLEGIAGLISPIGGLVVWLWRTATTVEKATIELGICKADVATLKIETRHLRDSGTRLDTLVGIMSAKLDKLDQVDRLVSSVEVMRSTVQRLDTLVVPRAEIEARFKGLVEGH